MTEVISLSEAREKGLPQFFTGVACKRGHVAHRYVKGSRCVACARIHSQTSKKKQAINDPEYYQRRWLWQKYGLTFLTYEAMLVRQNRCCATCSEPFVERPHVDHCHTNGHVRGLLCKECNWALGFVKDNPVTLAKMIEYLEATSPPLGS